MKLTPYEIQDFLDSLAALTAAHGLVLDVRNMIDWISLKQQPEDAPAIGGYVGAIPETDDSGCNVCLYCAGTADPDWRIPSIDVSRLSAHQRLELESALARVRAILRGEA